MREGAIRLANVGLAYAKRFERSGDLGDASAAGARWEEALSLSLRETSIGSACFPRRTLGPSLSPQHPRCRGRLGGKRQLGFPRQPDTQSRLRCGS